MAGIHNPLAALIVRMQGVKLGKGVKLIGTPVCVKTPNSALEIGDGCTINSSFLSNLAGMSQRSVLVSRDGASLQIGSNTGMSGVTIYAKKQIKIGNDCLLGVNVKIYDNDFHPADPNERLTNPNAGKARPVTIGNNVFIGANSIILKGVTIGDNSVVAAGSVVVRDILPNSLVGGNPAKVIKVFENENRNH